jgi:hypothetical protein
MSHVHGRAILAALTMSALVPLTAGAAQPESGTLSKKNRTVTWTGGPFASSVPNQLGCLGPDDPTCDAFALTVDLEPGATFAVAVAASDAADDYDLFVYYPDGTEAGRAATGSGNESLVLAHTTAHGTGPYAVRVVPFSVGASSTYQGLVHASRNAPTEGTGLVTCNPEPVPDAISIDLGNRVFLDVAVLLDGVSRALGEEIMRRAAESYAPLNVTLEVASFRAVTFTGTEGTAIIQQAKDFYGGERPRGADIVYVLTNKDLTDGGDPILAGLADCIGGVRFATRAFAVGEAAGIEPLQIGPFAIDVDAHPEIAAHEIGHLMGAHHHYANCVEGVLSGATTDVSPCSLMFNAVDFTSLNFSQANSAVVRGHAVKHAVP